MDCPACKAVLALTERQGIEIDYCPKCRGVWLDRGELDKIVERAGQAQTDDSFASRNRSTGAAPSPGRHREDDDSDEERFRRERSNRDVPSHAGPYRKKRSSWLGELLDFG